MKTVYIINSEVMGRGDDELGATIMNAFWKKLWANPNKPEAILFYNTGVKLLTREGGQLEAIHALHQAGVDMIACGTCVDKLGIRHQVAEGRISGMEDMVHHMTEADKVVTI